jgi:Holliday junction resolvase RusA-like endonuclease
MAGARKQIPMRRPVECVALDLPKPISVNALRRPKSTGGFCNTKVYESWKKEVGLLINAQRAGGVFGPYCLTISVTTKWGGDLGNCEKAVSDALQDNGVVQNDKLCQSIVIRRSESTIGMSVLVVSTQSKQEVA